MSDPPAIPEDGSGRLQLAEWITDPDNPLTGRVLVNRVWQQLFGAGLVATPDNFGKLGAAPSHPELLDFLAVKFTQEDRWSVKRLVRSLVLTRTYQLGSQWDAHANEVDPENVWLWRAAPRRLKAESIRDTILAASGRLDLDPPLSAVTAEFGDGYYGDNIWPQEFPTEYLKRSVYLPLPRDLVPESLALFDFPNPNLVIARREATTSPSQALFLMNNTFVQTEAVHFARRLLASAAVSDAARIREAYALALQRQPSEEEVRRGRKFLEEQTRLITGLKLATIPLPPAVEPSKTPDSEEEPATESPAGGAKKVRLIASQSLRADGKPAELVKRVENRAVALEPENPREAAYALFTQARGGDAPSLPASAEKSLLLPRAPHFKPRVKRVIFLGMQGAPSHVDTFEYKPKLKEDDGKRGRNNADRFVIGSPFKFQQHGQSGAWVSELFPHVAAKVDQLCFLRGMWTSAPALHPQAWPAFHTGSPLFVRPSMGSWVLYGLGTENQNLPGFVSIKPALSIGGGQPYEAAFLPSVFSATRIGDSKTPIQECDVSNISNTLVNARIQRQQLDLVQSMNRDSLARGHLNPQVEGVIESYELAFKMQSEVPDVTDLTKESQATFDLYGIGRDETDDFGRQCLLARRFAEAAVRFVEVCYDDWDHHGRLYSGLKKSCGATDQPIAGLLTDLKQRGLLDETLVIWGGEFGRTPDCPKPDGRDHNGKGWTMWMAGGGVKPGFSYGATDDYGVEAIEGRMDYHDLHATMLHLLGLDHEKLTYRYAGRDFRLTDVAGEAHTGILA